MRSGATFASMQTAGGSPSRIGGGHSPSKEKPQKKVSAQYQRYLDKMSEALNKNMEKNIFPHWRNHQSMKGKWTLYFISCL